MLYGIMLRRITVHFTEGCTGPQGDKSHQRPGLSPNQGFYEVFLPMLRYYTPFPEHPLSDLCIIRNLSRWGTGERVSLWGHLNSNIVALGNL